MSDQNEKTSVALLDGLELPPPCPLGAREAFIVAHDRLKGLARIARCPAVLVAAVDERARVVGAVIVESGDSLVIGRHTRCGLRLESNTVSLRQLAVYARAESPGAAPVIRLWDLNTQHPFLTEDGQRNAAVSAQGMLYAAVDEYALLLIPTRGPSEPPWPERAEDAWNALPPRQFVDRSLPNAVRLQHSQRLRSDGQPYHTQVTREIPLMMLGEHEGPEDVWGELQLVGTKKLESHRISLERLEQGVLLGRYDRCGIPLTELHSVSRVHLLLVQLGEELLAIDTASTNGTCRGRTRIETTTLDDVDSLELGGALQLHWRRLQS